MSETDKQERKPKPKGDITSFLNKMTGRQAEKAAAAAAKIDMVPIAEIAPDPDQPRKTFDQASLESLGASLLEHGFYQPLLLEPTGGSPAYTIIEGERRWRACQLVGITEVPAFIREDVPKARGLRGLAQLVANSQREQIPDQEMAIAIRQVLDEEGQRHGLKQRIAEVLNVPRERIARYLAMLEPDVAPLVDRGLLTNAETTAKFRALSDEARQKVVTIAEGESGEITRDMIERVRRDESAPSSIEPVGGDGAKLGSEDDNGESDPSGPSSPVGAAPNPSNVSPKTTPPAKRAAGAKLQLTGEGVEQLLRHLVDKSTDKLELRLPADLAIAVIENLGGEVPEKPDFYGQAISDLIVAKLR